MTVETRPRPQGRTSIRDVSLFVETLGNGYPLVLMHGGPGADHWSLLPFRQCADRLTVVFYDHRGNGRSTGPVSTMTWENLTADADALRERLGFDRWAVLGHSFGGHVALEYALRYPQRVSHLVLLDTGGSSWWSQEHAPRVLAERGFSPRVVGLAKRFFNGRIAPGEMMRGLMAFGGAYYSRPSVGHVARMMLRGEWRAKLRPEALIHAGRHLLPDWTVMARLGAITAPTLVIAGRDDFIFPPAHQIELAAGIPHARLHIVERAGHNPHEEQTEEVMTAIRNFVRP